MSWPTTPTPNKEVFVTVRFAPDEAAELTAAYTASGTSKSAFIRRCVARAIASDKRKAEALRTGEVGGSSG